MNTSILKNMEEALMIGKESASVLSPAAMKSIADTNAKVEPFPPAHPYAELRRVLDLAYDQSASGKGAERHANSLPFTKQSIMELGRMTGVGGPVFQVMKKAREAKDMSARGEHEKAMFEMLGVMVYASAAYLLMEELNNGQ